MTVVALVQYDDRIGGDVGLSVKEDAGLSAGGALPDAGLDELDWEVPSYLAGSHSLPDQQRKASGPSRASEAPAREWSTLPDAACAVGESDLVAHLVQDREVIDRLQSEDLPPDEYYEELEPLLQPPARRPR